MFFCIKETIFNTSLKFAKNNVKCFSIAARTGLLNEEQHCPLVVKEIF